jgi:ATP phosphoribosyltransferase regulatory subunit HisZ
VELASLRGGPEILERQEGTEGLQELHALLEQRGVADRVIFDLGMLRELRYYTGTIFEVYDPAVAFALGGGGRYDDLLGRFGRPRPACGFGLDVTRAHVAQIEEERGA